jgi:hypothetical protein
MRFLLAATGLLLLACGQPRSLEYDVNQPLTHTADLPTGSTPMHGYWALSRWPTLVRDEAGSCPAEAVDEALKPFHDAGIEIKHEVGKCRSDHWYIEDGRLCLRTDDEGLSEHGLAGSAYWWPRPGTSDEIAMGGINVQSDCNPMVIAHEVGHLLGLGHSKDKANTMYPLESDVLSFDAADLQAIVARRAAYLAR